MYKQTAFGPGNIAALQSGVGLTQGPTIGSNDPGSFSSSGGSRGAYSIPPVSGCCGMGRVHGHAPVPMAGLGACDENCQKWVKWGLVGVLVLFGVSYLHDRYSTPTLPHY